MARNQTEIPGTERKKDKQLSAAIEDIQELRTKRADAKVKLDSASERLVGMMVKKGLTEYIDPDLKAKVTIADKTNLSLVSIKVKETSVDG